MVWRISDPQGDEAAKVKYDIVRYTRGVGMDVGCGPAKAFRHMIGVDSKKDVELFGISMTVDLVVPDATRLTEHVQPASLPYVFSSHMLEHVEDFEACLADWWSCIQPDGYLILYLPHKDLYPNIGEAGSNPDHQHDFLPFDIVRAMCNIGTWDLLVNEKRDAGREYSFLQVYQKKPAGHAYSHVLPRPPKTVCVIRHGGIGDQLQAAYLLPQLKREGFHVTLLTTARGREPIEHDPHIDDWYMVDVDQVPNHELGLFWKSLAKYYDRIVNLNESVEGAWLALPGRIQHTWPHALRHKHLNQNYAEHAAGLAEIPFRAEGQFYPLHRENVWADDFLAAAKARAFGTPRMGERDDAYYVMVACAGSSPHKFNNHQDEVIGEILKRLKRAIVIFVGDYAAKLLEQGFEAEPRVSCSCGVLNVRQTLTLAQHMHCVLGPETGVLNSVCYAEQVKKVVLLSHSSEENLTKHWANTTAVRGVAPCWPCHQLHYNNDYCPRDEETRTALCQFNMHYPDIYAPIDADYTGWARTKLLQVA